MTTSKSMKEKSVPFIRAAVVVLGTSVALQATALEPVSAATFSVGNSTGGLFVADFFPPGEIIDLPFPGQSFTPNVPGDAGSGTAPTSGSVLLNSFTLGTQNSGIAYVFDSRFTGIPADLSSQTVGVNGLLGSSTSVSNGTYKFAENGLKLADVSAEYFVYIDTRVNFELAQGNPYTGGTGFAAEDPINRDPTYILGSEAGLDDPDLVFFANLTTVPEPVSGLGLLALGALGTGLTLKKKLV
ncbi:MAG: hypothetical protein F6K02_33210 [Moorea sp. SIO3A5]|nr:hypothetical protein [Moorena sp. SIO3A5]